MPRRKSNDDKLIEGLATLIVALVFVIWFTPSLKAKAGFILLLAVAVSGLIAFIVLPRYLENKRFAGLTLDNVDAMTGEEFERYVARLLEHQGYKTRTTPQSGDFGIDVVAIKGAERIAIQCKRWKKPVSRTAVSDAVAGMSHYNCNVAMVVTSSYFTNDAKTLATSNNCRLVDRNTLAEWVSAVHHSALSVS